MKNLLTLSVMLLYLPLRSMAGTLAATPLSASAGFDSRPFVVGWKFAVTTPLTIEALAYLDPTGTGLAEPHKVGIFDASTGTLLLSAVVPQGNAVPYQNGFRLSKVSYFLAPGTYVVAGQRPSDADAALVRARSVLTSPQITYLEERDVQSSDFVMPGANTAGDEVGSFGPSFVITDTMGSSKTISAIVNSGSFLPSFAAGTYLSIFGSNLSSGTRTWAPSDFGEGVRLPVSLDGVSVTVNGTPAYVEFISPGQLNIVVPDLLPAIAGVPVIVTYPGQADVTAWINAQRLAPAFFTWPTSTPDTGKYIVAQHVDSSNVGKVGLFPEQGPRFTTPAHPGEIVVLYGTGFGATNPLLPGGVIADKSYPLATTPTATVGGHPAIVAYSGMVASLSDIYQVNLTIPSDLQDGDWPLVVTLGGISSPPVLVTVAR